MSSMNLGLFKTSHFCLSGLVASPIYSDILAGKIHIFHTVAVFSTFLAKFRWKKLKSKKNTAKSKIQCVYYVDIRNINFNIQIILTFHLESLCYPALCFLKIPPNVNRYRFLNISAAFERKILNIEEATAILRRILYNLSRIRHVHLSKPTIRVCRTRKREADLQVKICIACFLRVYSN